METMILIGLLASGAAVMQEMPAPLCRHVVEVLARNVEVQIETDDGRVSVLASAHCVGKETEIEL